MVLGEVAYFDPGADFQSAFMVGNLAHHDFREGGFPFAVASYQGHFLAFFQREVEMGEYPFFAVAFADVLGSDHDFSAMRGRREAEGDRGVVGFVHFDALHLLQHLDS